MSESPNRNTCHARRPGESVDDFARRVVRAMSSSGKFWLSQRGVILFERFEGHGYVGLANEHEISSALSESDALSWIGPAPAGEEARLLARSVANRRWMLRPASLRPSRASSAGAQ